MKKFRPEEPIHELNLEVVRELSSSQLAATYLARRTEANTQTSEPELLFLKQIGVPNKRGAGCAWYDAWRDHQAELYRRCSLPLLRPWCVQRIAFLERQRDSLAVFPLLDGVDLAAWLDQEPPPPAQARLAVLYALLESVCRLHAAGIVHGDLKPENIFWRARPISSDARVNAAEFHDITSATRRLVLLDFDRSFIPILGVPWHSSGHGYVGTQGWCSPEHLSGTPSFRSDVFSLGIIMHALCGRRGMKVASLDLARHPPGPPLEVLEDIPHDFDSFAQACLHPDSDSRPHAETLLQSLRTLLGLDAGQHSPTMDVNGTEEQRVGRRNPTGTKEAEQGFATQGRNQPAGHDATEQSPPPEETKEAEVSPPSTASSTVDEASTPSAAAVSSETADRPLSARTLAPYSRAVAPYRRGPLAVWLGMRSRIELEVGSSTLRYDQSRLVVSALQLWRGLPEEASGWDPAWQLTIARLADGWHAQPSPVARHATRINGVALHESRRFSEPCRLTVLNRGVIIVRAYDA